MRWALGCFGAFAGARTNSSELLHARLKAGDRWAGRVDFLPALPVTFADAWPALRGELARRPDVGGVLMLGQAAGRRRVDLERVALNFVDADVPDNAGVVPRPGPLTAGPDLRWCRIPWESFSTPHPCARSYSAGTYVCNAVLYESLGWADAAPGRLAGFVHVPVLRSQEEFAHLPRLDDDVALAALEDILDFLVKA